MNELIADVRADVVVKVCGDDLEQLISAHRDQDVAGALVVRGA